MYSEDIKNLQLRNFIKHLIRVFKKINSRIKGFRGRQGPNDNCCQLIDTWIFPISSLCPFLHLSEPQTGEHQLRI